MHDADAVSLFDRRPGLDGAGGLGVEPAALQAPQLVVPAEDEIALLRGDLDRLGQHCGRGAEHRVDDVPEAPELLAPVRTAARTTSSGRRWPTSSPGPRRSSERSSTDSSRSIFPVRVAGKIDREHPDLACGA